jgi:hypothetical protein
MKIDFCEIDWGPIAEGAIAAATIGLTIVTGLLVRATTRLWTSSEKLVTKTQFVSNSLGALCTAIYMTGERAVLPILKVEIEEFDKIKLSNAGAGPATRIWYLFGDKEDERHEFNTQTLKEGDGVLETFDVQRLKKAALLIKYTCVQGANYLVVVRWDERFKRLISMTPELDTGIIRCPSPAMCISEMFQEDAKRNQ